MTTTAIAINQYTKPIQKLSKEVKSDNVCFRKVGRAITLWGAIEKNGSLDMAPKIILHFWGFNNILVGYIMN